MDDATYTAPAAQALRLNRRPGRHGYVIPMVMMFLIIVSLIGVGLMTLAGTELELYKRTEASRQAFFLAEAGAQRMQALLAVEESWVVSPGTGTVFSEEILANGTYTARLEDVSTSEATIVSEGTYPRTGALQTTRRVRLVVER